MRIEKPNFVPAVFSGSASDVCNPGRGWYQMFLLQAKLETPVNDWLGCMRENEKLALLFVSLQAYADQSLDAAALLHIDQALRFFAEQKKDVILRFAYDCDGNGIAHEPALSKIIIGHMRQLKPVLARYEKTIFCIQGLFAGSWGEMHNSRFLSGDRLCSLWDEWCDCVPEGCFFAVRTPAQWRILARHAGMPDFGNAAAQRGKEQTTMQAVRALRLGLFNDGLLGSDTDLGTFLPEKAGEELAFQDALCRLVPNGGEAVSGKADGTGRKETDVFERNGVPEGAAASAIKAIAHFEKLHISYLNCVHDAALLEQWKKTGFRGETAYSYIGKRLGYRFVVCSAVWNQKRRRLQVTIENQGFANCYEEADVRILLCDGQAVLKELPVETDIRLWQAGEQTALLADLRKEADACGEADSRKETVRRRNLSTEAAKRECTVYLKAVRKKDGCPIRFANEGAADDIELGRFFYGRQKDK